MDMKKLMACLAATLLTSCAHQEACRLERVKVHTLHQYHEHRGGLLYACDTYGITDPSITSIVDVVNSLTVTNWDSRYDEQDYVCLKKTIDKGSRVLDYTVKVSRPRNSDPWALEAMGSTDQGQYLELCYIVEERTPGVKNVSPFVSTNDADGNPILIDGMTQEHLESKKPNPTQQSLSNLLSRIDRIRVVDAGMAEGDLVLLSTNEAEIAEVLLDTSAPKQIESFRACFNIVEDTNTFGHCMCLGWPTFEFISGKTVVTRIGFHHGQSIRWSEWKYDAFLKRNEDVLSWLASNGVPQPKKAYEADLAQAEESRKQYERWLAAAPESIRAQVRALDWGNPFAPQDDLKAIRESLSSTASPEAQVLSLFKWYGSGCGPWSGFPSYEELPNALLMQIPTAVLLQSLTNTLSDAHVEGAARFFTSSDFNRRRNPDRKTLPDDLKRRIREHVIRQKDQHKAGQVEYYLPK